MKYIKSMICTAISTVAILLALISISGAQTVSHLDEIKEKGVLRVGWAVVYPDFYRVPGKDEYTGLSYEIVNDLAKTMGVKLELVEDNWSTLIAGLQSNKFDMTIPALGITLPRALAISYSEPLYSDPIGFMIRKSDSEKFKELEDFDKPSVRLSVTLGSNADMFLSRAMKNATIIRVKAAPDSITQLLTNHADAWVSPMHSFEKVSKEQPSLMPFNLDIGESPVAFGLPAGDYRLKEWIDLYINELRATGQLEQMMAKYGM